ncbi:MAG: hypothetical protein QOE11_2851 [Solirubrobacteraceae bacterium]|jgi:hypothetical protein|nr:hypothetical protein [Solirubrobacteraceae bacterium]
MSASADGTTSDYSKGPVVRPAGFAAIAAIAAGLALAAALLLVVAEFSTVVRIVVGSLETQKRAVAGHAEHGYALLVVAVAAAPMTLGALRGARAAAVALAALGAVALFVALAIDLPKTRESGQLPESVAFEDAHAKAGPGLALEIAGGAGLVLAGGLLLVAAGGAGAARGRVARSSR